MRAAIFSQPGAQLSIEDVSLLPPGPGDAVVEISASGVCHTDLSILEGALPYPPPLVLGHEACGVVTWVGNKVSTVKVGDRVISSADPMCGNCWFCTNDQPNLCTTLYLPPTPRVERSDGTRVTGMSGLGTFAEEMVVDQAFLVPVQTDLPATELALIGCGVTTGVGAVLNAAQVRPGATVAVIGCGGVGLAAIQGARLSGAGRVIAVDLLDSKLSIAAKLGATDLVVPGEASAADQVLELTGGLGVDVAIEVVGRVETINSALAMTRRGGEVVLVGAGPVDAQLQIGAFDFLMSEKRLVGSVFGSSNIRRDFPRFVRMVETGQLDLASLITATIDLSQVNSALQALANGEAIRSVIVR
jgi:S-(hydroxymethyl)glutathione dehydrogenase / alcohol dehydrogenase